MKITVVGTGYVGLSLSVLLAAENEVTAVDIVKEKVDLINRRKSPLKDEYIERYLAEKDLNLVATLDGAGVYENAEAVLVAVPTDYDAEKKGFDTTAVEKVIKAVTEENPGAFIVVKSTVPIGFTESMRRKYGTNRILFSPEFLREGKALFDNLYPARIIVGGDFSDKSIRDFAKKFADKMIKCSLKDDIPTLFVGSSDAEAIKLFSNAYLAMRIGYFNEIDTFSEIFGLDAKGIIEGMGLDTRIGAHYNNPSFGYGGYCLPKDTKQLLSQFECVPESIISAIVASNEKRKDFIADSVVRKLSKIKKSDGKKCIVGIYRLTMKSGSDNFRDSAVFGVIDRLKEKDVDILIYEPTAKDAEFFGITTDLAAFKTKSDLILANRFDEEISDVLEKVYTRDIFGRD